MLQNNSVDSLPNARATTVASQRSVEPIGENKRKDK
jgi:hypothetical protein